MKAKTSQEYIIIHQPCPCCNPAFSVEDCLDKQQIYSFKRKIDMDEAYEELRAIKGWASAKSYPEIKDLLKLVHTANEEDWL